MIVFQYVPKPTGAGMGGSILAFDSEIITRLPIGHLHWYKPGHAELVLCNDIAGVRGKYPERIDVGYQIKGISVLGSYQRRGIATAMLAEARKYAPVTHSIVRTVPGNAWALSTGEPLPECPCGHTARGRNQ